MNSNTPNFFYFKGRGKGEVCRLILAFTGTKFHDNRVNYPLEESFKKSLNYGQIPLYEDDDIRLFQSRAIARYIASKNKIDGRNPVEKAMVDEVSESIWDLISLVNLPKEGESKETYIKVTIPTYLGAWEKRIQENGGTCLFGDHLTMADISVFHAYDHLKYLGYGEYRNGYPKLEKLVKYVESQPNIAEYLKNRPSTL
eukprot:gene4189-5244_t